MRGVEKAMGVAGTESRVWAPSAVAAITPEACIVGVDATTRTFTAKTRRAAITRRAVSVIALPDEFLPSSRARYHLARSAQQAPRIGLVREPSCTFGGIPQLWRYTFWRANCRLSSDVKSQPRFVNKILANCSLNQKAASQNSFCASLVYRKLCPQASASQSMRHCARTVAHGVRCLSISHVVLRSLLACTKGWQNCFSLPFVALTKQDNQKDKHE